MLTDAQSQTEWIHVTHYITLYCGFNRSFSLATYVFVHPTWRRASKVRCHLNFFGTHRCSQNGLPVNWWANLCFHHKERFQCESTLARTCCVCFFLLLCTPVGHDPGGVAKSLIPPLISRGRDRDHHFDQYQTYNQDYHIPSVYVSPLPLTSK